MTRATAFSARRLAIAMVLALVVGLTLASVALAEEMPGMDTGGEAMPGMDMSGEDAGQDDDGHGDMAGMPGMGGSANWFVVGGFVALVAAATAAAVIVKRRLRDRMLRGELATEGVLDA